jgi:hypothetical protein
MVGILFMLVQGEQTQYANKDSQENFKKNEI